jgi:hypothetical protein
VFLGLNNKGSFAMNRLFWLILMFSFQATAQTGDMATTPGTRDGRSVYVEFALPFEWIHQFGLEKFEGDEEKKKNNGWFGVEFGARPFANSINPLDSALSKFLKRAIFSVDVNLHNTERSLYEDYLYSYDKEVPHNNVTSTCYTEDADGTLDWDGNCYDCPHTGGYCTNEDVFGHPAYLRYSAGSVGLGMMFPLAVAKRIEADGGLVVRFNNVKEGWDTDHMTSSIATTLSLKGKIAVNLTKSGSHAITASAEKSAMGKFKYTKAQVGYRIRWGGNR